MTETQIKKFEAFAEKCMGEIDAVGMTVAVVDREGRTHYEKMFGVKDQKTGAPIDEDTIFGLASVTKSFTCLAIMQMAEEGILSIDDPVSKYIPEFTGKNQEEPVLIKHLMFHSGGYFPLERILINPVAQELGLKESVDGDFAFNESLAQEGCRRVATRLDAQTELIGKPGEYLSYFNDGYALLSDIVYRHGDCNSFAEYLVKHILKPLGMERSGCDFVKTALDDNHATLYEKIADELTVRDYHDEAFVLNGGGAMKSTLSDMKKYLTMYLNHGKGLNGAVVAKPETIAEMTAPHQLYHYDSQYCFGLSEKTMNGHKIVGHSGSLPGVSSHIEWCDETGLGVIVLCNTSDMPSEAVAEAAMNLVMGYEPINLRYDYEEMPWTEEMMNAACGVYASGEGTTAELYRENGKMMVKSGEQSYPVKMFASKWGLIQKEITDTFLECISDEDRGVYGLRYGSRILPRKK